MFARLVLFVATLAAATTLNLSAYAQAPITVVEDYEGEFPGVIAFSDPNVTNYPGGFGFTGGANGPPSLLQQEITESGGFDSIQAYKVTADAANEATGWGWYYGMGHFVGFYGENFGFAQGQAGEDAAGNYTLSFDLKAVGHTSLTPITGDFVLYKPDYEMLNNVDLNEDGDMTDGYDIFIKALTVPEVPDNYANYNHVTFNLGTGAAPTAAVPDATNPNAPKTPITPFFEDESTFLIRLYFNSGGFGSDDGNSFTLDNLAVTFTPPGVTLGDFDGNTQVDGNDFLKWQRGELEPPVDAGDLAEWRDAFPDGGVTAIPEPTAGALAACGLVGMLGARRRRRG